MSGAEIAGYGAKYAGLAMSQVFQTTFAQYRPINSAPPDLTPALDPTCLLQSVVPGFVTTLANANRHGSLGNGGNLAAVTWDAPDPAKPRQAAFIDPAILALGDYIVGPYMQGQENQTLYVSLIAAPSPIVVVRCNAVLNVVRGVVPTVFGAQPPLDDQAGDEVALANGWPASVLREGRGQEGDTKLPGDVKLGGYLVLMPVSVPAALRSGDILTITSWLDNPIIPVGTRLIVAMAEGTPDGWKLLCQEAMT